MSRQLMPESSICLVNQLSDGLKCQHQSQGPEYCLHLYLFENMPKTIEESAVDPELLIPLRGQLAALQPSLFNAYVKCVF